MHYYQFNIADYRKDTAHLTPIEHYIYRSLIDWYYLDEKPIPTETQVVIRRLCLGSEMVTQLTNVLSDFFNLTENGYQHKRIDSEIVGYHEMAKKNATNGKLGGRPRKTQSVTTGNPNESQKKPNHKPITNNQEPITILKPLSENSDVFDKFWFAYPKKVGKDAAKKSWFKTKPDIDEVIKALNWQRESKQWKKNGGQFIPHPSTYLNEGRFKDEQPEEESYEFFGSNEIDITSEVNHVG